MAQLHQSNIIYPEMKQPRRVSGVALLLDDDIEGMVDHTKGRNLTKDLNFLQAMTDFMLVSIGRRTFISDRTGNNIMVGTRKHFSTVSYTKSYFFNYDEEFPVMMTSKTDWGEKLTVTNNSNDEIGSVEAVRNLAPIQFRVKVYEDPSSCLLFDEVAGPCCCCDTRRIIHVTYEQSGKKFGTITTNPRHKMPKCQATLLCPSTVSEKAMFIAGTFFMEDLTRIERVRKERIRKARSTRNSGWQSDGGPIFVGYSNGGDGGGLFSGGGGLFSGGGGGDCGGGGGGGGDCGGGGGGDGGGGGGCGGGD
ncbi:hypothetical protein FHG87_000335 [Trinorchestia longiramus]|nr:hypothetical protein FHG87_000335 [Trinorchestia longiramus]